MFALVISDDYPTGILTKYFLHEMEFNATVIGFNHDSNTVYKELELALDAHSIVTADLIFIGSRDIQIVRLVRSRTHAPLIVNTVSYFSEPYESELLSLVDGRLTMPW